MSLLTYFGSEPGTSWPPRARSFFFDVMAATSGILAREIGDAERRKSRWEAIEDRDGFLKVKFYFWWEVAG